ncbi:hypothetical protein EJG51_006740 [Undibacterium piscinae]|jgi:hypothetical protein|uniref:Uncharacterized protein n=1 Tax=Undibacterium piscinae TaxID=2495591 RepID=A0A6M4A4W2_9BURK|nr:hypothetical protein EJG51_006740 [Undibacterium piscinae]
MEQYSQLHKEPEQEQRISPQDSQPAATDIKEIRRQLGWDLMEAQRQWRSR